MVERQISISIPTYNRTDLLYQSFEQVYSDPRVKEIIVSDDHSDPSIYTQLQSVLYEYPKVKLFRNEVNIDCFRNKHRAVALATSDWVCLWDSDNVFGKDYLDKLFEINEWRSDTIYTPDYAKPSFDFRNYSGLLLTKESVPTFIDKPMLEVALNAANYFIPRKQWLEVWDGSNDPVTSDSIWVAYNWLKAGNKIQVVDGLEYFHRVHDGSHYQNNVHRTPNGFHEQILNKLRSIV